MEQWLVSMKKADFGAIASRFDIDPVTARLIRNRGLTEFSEIDKYLNGTLNDLYPPALLKDMDRACGIISEKISQKKRIRVIGDYDIDGIMSTYILLSGLKRLGALADERIPERIRDGYGLNENLVKSAHADSVDTIITCDNGISAYEQIRLAKELGMTVIVTDHHEVPFDAETSAQIIPPADAVIDPKQDMCSYPFKGLCGAVVAWKLISCLYSKHGVPQNEAENFLMFAAIATVGDVCDLQDENRIIVKYGIEQLAHSKHYGLNALMSLNGLDPAAITTYHIGFIIGPCLNASGRLDTAEKALALMNAASENEAIDLASELINMNQSRKEMTEEYAKKAYEIAESEELSSDRVLVVYLPDCHESLAGIIAGRLREKYNKPAFVITDSESGAKGSGRSIDEYSMYTELVKCGGLMTQFGGHPKAAGLSLEKDNIDMLREALNANCVLTEEDLAKKIHADMVLPLRYITESLINDFEKLKPFGQGNPRPLFVQKELSVISPSVVGKNRNVVRMQLSDRSGCRIPAVYFGDADAFMEYISDKKEISAVFYPAINTFRGVSSIQLTITNYR
ncbi:MAG TPA: single-stranded-DNA-specific exonuclease RecJ [Candidatus Alectryocaccobium stercorigallinarum]|nr:single-stranded-DNA-specific exonuclease RecJ [Candidatus Alectryocaccobium stercorigallinarum]